MAHGAASGCAGVAAGYGVSNRSTSRCDGDPRGLVELRRDSALSPLRHRSRASQPLGHLPRDLSPCVDRAFRLETVNRPPDPRAFSLGLVGQIHSLGKLEDVLELMGDVLERPGIERNHYASDSDTIFGDAESGLGSKLQCFDPWPEDGSRRFATPRPRRCCAPRSKSCWPCLDY
jgi:hypothetical protein